MSLKKKRGKKYFLYHIDFFVYLETSNIGIVLALNSLDVVCYPSYKPGLRYDVKFMRKSEEV